MPFRIGDEYQNPDFARDPLWVMQHNPPRENVILFIHGLGSSPTDCWGDFPRLVFDDNQLGEVFDVALYRYGSSTFRLPFGAAPDLRDKSRVLRSQIVNVLSERYSEIVLLCHSLGGLLAKLAVMALGIYESVEVRDRIKVIFTLGTPHYGSIFASFNLLASPEVRALRVFSREITDIQEYWNSKVIDEVHRIEPDKHVLFERSIVSVTDRWVGFGSAIGGLNQRFVHSLELAHGQLAKPANREASQYVYFRDELLKIFQDVRSLKDTQRQALLEVAGKAELTVSERFRRAKDLGAQNLGPQAEELYKQILDSDPEYVPALNNLGILRSRGGDFNGARGLYSKARVVEPENSRVLYNAACNESRAGKVDLAIEYLQEAIKKSPHYQELAVSDSDFDSIRDDPRFPQPIS